MTATTYSIGGDLTVNRMGFGAMRITGANVSGWPANRDQALAVVRRAVELGVNFIDTADQYGPFVSEELIAEALHPYPADVVVATKGGLVRYGSGSAIKRDGTPQHLHDALDGSLRRLRRDRIDLYQLHRIDPDVPAEATFSFLRNAQDAGKVRHLGLSEVTVDEIEQARQFFTVTTVQNRYSVTERAAEPVLDYCRKHGIAFIPWYPLGGGDLGYSVTLARIADRHHVGSRQVALAWLLQHAENILLIPGTSDAAHLEQNLAAAEISLTPGDIAELDNLTPNPQQTPASEEGTA